MARYLGARCGAALTPLPPSTPHLPQPPPLSSLPFGSLEQLRQRPAHLAAFLLHCVLQFEPGPAVPRCAAWGESRESWGRGKSREITGGGVGGKGIVEHWGGFGGKSREITVLGPFVAISGPFEAILTAVWGRFGAN